MAHGSKVSLATAIYNTDARWTRDVNATHWLQTDITDEGELCFEILPPHAMARLARVRVGLKGGAGHGALPNTMPAVRTGTCEWGVTTFGAWTVDTSATVLAYEAEHNLDALGLDNDPLGCGTVLLVSVRGETGPGDELNLMLADIICQWTSEDAP
jgi:hypothetical protein